MNDIGFGTLREGAAGAGTVDIWARDFIDNHVMKGLRPSEPFIDRESSVIACGSGFSAMLRGRDFAKHAEVLSPRRYGTVLPMIDAQPLAVADALGIFDWILRSRGSNPIGEGEEAERVRRRLKRAVQQARLVAFTFGTNHPAGGLAAGDVHRDVRKIHLLLRRFSPEARMLLAIDPSPVAGPHGAELNVPASTAIKSALRAGIQEFLDAEASELNQKVFYFPVYELTQDFAHIALPPAPILDIFKAYYTSGGPTVSDAVRAYQTSRLKMIAAVRRAAGDILPQKAAA